MRSYLSGWLMILIMLAVDFYFYRSVRHLTDSWPARIKTVFNIAYLLFTVLGIVGYIILPLINLGPKWHSAGNLFGLVIIIIFFSKVIGCLFFLIDDIRRLIQIGVLKTPAKQQGPAGETMPRSVFLTWTGLSLSSVFFGSLIYGLSNKYNYKIRRHKIAMNGLPESFKGLKIIQISDIHSGSFTNKAAVEKGVEKIMQEQADIIFFTGDIVNSEAWEMDDYIEVFKKIAAPMGVYAILGNHDYGDYAHWESMEAKQANLQKLKQIYPQMGWRLLLNEHIVLEKNSEKIALLGVENWSAKDRFPKYGNLAAAYQGAEDLPVKILLSHDPSHWEAEVLKQYPGIGLMLAGHTHGMQFGVEIPGFKWSPVQYYYKQWAGLYKSNDQYLYVNRGFGFLGYPGRVGIMPEITVLELA